MADKRVLVTFSPPEPVRKAITETIGSLAEVTYLRDVEPTGRIGALESADVVLGLLLGRELNTTEEYEALGSVRLLQLLSAGADQVPFSRIPKEVPVASNAGSYAGPMAEHVLAMALGLAKRLPQQHAAMQSGVFDQQTPNLAIRGAVVTILGFGGIGRASALLFRAFGARIRAITRSGSVDEWVENVGGLSDLDRALEGADILVISLPLTIATRGLIAERELSLMKQDGILVNVGRAAIVDEDALYGYLKSHPNFRAGIDVWWDEPRPGERFAPRLPFLELPNVLGSPHNSTITKTALADSAREAAANVVRALRGEPVQHVVDRNEYVDRGSRPSAARRGDRPTILPSKLAL
jgi:phosphoglycerate dehydrogenase-like enzyme